MTVAPEPEPQEDTDSGTFVAVIITLAVLVLALLCAGGVGWWFWIRPTEWKHIEESPSVENVRVDSNNPPATVEVTERTNDEEVKDRPSVVVNGHTWTGKGFLGN